MIVIRRRESRLALLARGLERTTRDWTPERTALAIMIAGMLLLALLIPSPLPPADARASRVQAPARTPLIPLLPVPLDSADPLAGAVAGPPASPDAAAIDPQRAFAINGAMPISAAPNPVATPFILGAVDPVIRARALDCLTAAVYYEAASEGEAGQAAVAQVVLNRVRNPAYPKSVCGVVFDGAGGASASGGCQFTFACDGAMARTPTAIGWLRAHRIAEAAVAGAVAPSVGWSTHYHTHYVAPAWAPTLLKTAVIGAHIFYRPPAPWNPRAPGNRYAGSEPAIALMVPLSVAHAAARAGLAVAGGDGQPAPVPPVGPTPAAHLAFDIPSA